MAKSLVKYAVILAGFSILTVSFSGCINKTYTPKLYPVKPGMIPPMSIHQSINVVNAQTNQNYKIIFNGREVQEANLREVTEVAIRILTDELRKKGAVIDPDASKILKLSISKIQYLPTGWGSNCLVQLNVETGEGYYYDIARNNVGYSAGGGPSGASCDFAVTRTVVGIFENNRFMEYLNSP